MTETSVIEELYRKYAKKLYSTALRICGDSGPAEEAMQDAFVKFHLKTDREKSGILNVEAYLTRVCANNAIDALRKRKKDGKLFPEISPEERKAALGSVVSDEEDVEEGWSVEAVRHAMSLLSDGFRIIISLRAFEGFSYSEIARITGLKETSVRSRYSRGMSKLRELL